jgi:hypothetical protein
MGWEVTWAAERCVAAPWMLADVQGSCLLHRCPGMVRSLNVYPSLQSVWCEERPEEGRGSSLRNVRI